MTVTVTRSGEKVEDTIKKRLMGAVDVIVPMVIGFIQRRTAKGIDRTGAAFRPYSVSYALQLFEGGEEANVDLTVTGAYLKGISERNRVWVGDSLTITIGPGTGTSEKRLFKGFKAKRTGQRSPPHNVLGAYLERGTPKMPARPHLGLTPEETKKVGARLRRYLQTGS